MRCNPPLINSKPNTTPTRLDFCGIIAGHQGPHTFSVYKDHQELICTLAKEATFKLSNQLVVGDQVILNHQQQIQTCLPRTNQLIRFRGDHTRNTLRQKEEHIIAVNIDQAIIIVTAAEPKFSPSLLDRYLLLCAYGGIQPLICLNKCDLTNIRHPILKSYQETLGIAVIETSIKNNSGLEELTSKVLGKSSVVIGASGVGKTSIINQLLGMSLRTQSISSKTKRGRHTTTSSHLYPLKEGYIIDTPGVRSLGIGNLRRSALKDYFPEFESAAQQCKYRDCLHVYEEDCGVKAAQGNQVIKIRYPIYLRIFKSLQE